MSQNNIKKSLIAFLKKGNSRLKKIPLNKQLLEKGYLDSFAFVELVSFIENSYKIKILYKEITPEKFGTLNKMIKVIETKIKKSGKKPVKSS